MTHGVCRDDGPRAVAGELGLRTLSPEHLAEVGQLWSELERRIGSSSVMSSWEWTATFLEAYRRFLDVRFVVAERSGECVGIVLMTRSVRKVGGRVPVRALRLGTTGEPRDEIFTAPNRLLVVPEVREEFARSLIDHVRSVRGWDELRVDGFVPQDAEQLLHGGGWRVRRESCPAMVFPEDGDVVAGLSKNTRYRVRRSMRDLGPLQTEWADTEQQARDVFEELRVLHRARWADHGGGVLDGRAADFHRAVITRWLPTGRVVLFRVRAAGRTIGCIYGFVEDRRLLQYQSGFHRADDSKVKLGHVTHVLCMQHAARRGLVAYDFLAGDARYKRELSNADGTLVWASRYSGRPRGRALTLGRLVAERAVRARGHHDETLAMHQ